MTATACWLLLPTSILPMCYCLCATAYLLLPTSILPACCCLCATAYLLLPTCYCLCPAPSRVLPVWAQHLVGSGAQRLGMNSVLGSVTQLRIQRGVTQLRIQRGVTQLRIQRGVTQLRIQRGVTH